MSYKKKISYTVISYLLGTSDYGIFENDSLMEETSLLLSSLVDINEYGIITSASQPGTSKQRAYLVGYIPKELSKCVSDIKDKNVMVLMSGISGTLDFTSSIIISEEDQGKYKELSLKVNSADMSALQDFINGSSNLRDFKLNFKYFVIVDLEWNRLDYIFKLLLDSIKSSAIKKRLSKDDVRQDDDW